MARKPEGSDDLPDSGGCLYVFFAVILVFFGGLFSLFVFDMISVSGPNGFGDWVVSLLLLAIGVFMFLGGLSYIWRSIKAGYQ